jgi:hypothetical protein
MAFYHVIIVIMTAAYRSGLCIRDFYSTLTVHHRPPANIGCWRRVGPLHHAAGSAVNAEPVASAKGFLWLMSM